MHIPDGFLSPTTYLPAYGIATVLWGYALSRIRRVMNESTIPFIGMMSALSFALMSIAIPLPGGSSAHATGIPLFATLFGVWTTFVCVTLVLILQTLVLGEGGITALAINALAMGFFGAFSAKYLYRLTRRMNPYIALFLAAWSSIMVQAILTAVLLGVQPMLASDRFGQPLFFPFDLHTTLPAILLPHIWVGIGEGVITISVIKLLCKKAKSDSLPGNICREIKGQ